MNRNPRWAGIGVVLAALCLACQADTTGLETVSVTELAAQLSSASPPVLCDANSEDTRSRYGTIPGAVLLTSYRDYDPGSELGPELDRALVFYCHSARCGAAVDAARKAVAAGYTRVAVLPDGITGWRDAGRDVAQTRVGS